MPDCGSVHAPSFEELRSRAEGLVPRLRERARAAEGARRLPDETIAELEAAQLFDAQKPARYGGFELGLVEFVELVATLGRGCGSTSWVYGVTAERAWLLGKFSARAQEDVWGTKRAARITSSISPDGRAMPEAGGFRVSGHWHFVSGIDIADWAVFCALLPAAADDAAADARPKPPALLYVLVPLSDCQVIDNWHVAGLAATGSRDVKLADVFVPEHRTVRVPELKEGGGPGLAVNTSPLFRLPLIAINPFSIVAPMLGMAQGALELTIESARRRRMTSAGATLSVAEQQSVQLRIAESAAEIDAARALILEDCRDAMATVERDQALSVAQRIRIRRNHGYVAKTLTSAVDRLFTVAGGRGIYLDQFVQRAWRDTHAAAAHFGLSWDMLGTLWGQHTFGLPISNPAY